MKRSERGFTLVEVMGAVALLAILYTFLAGDAIQALRNESESKRRLEASLLMDATLAEIETSYLLGITPPVGETETEIDEFRVAVNVQHFSASAEWGQTVWAGVKGMSPLFGPAVENAEPTVKTVRIRIGWGEGIYARGIERITMLVDYTTVAILQERSTK